MNKSNRLLGLLNEYKVGDKLSVDWDGNSDIEIVDIDSKGMIHIKRPNYKGNPEENYLIVSSDELDDMKRLTHGESSMPPEADWQDQLDWAKEALKDLKSIENTIKKIKSNGGAFSYFGDGLQKLHAEMMKDAQDYIRDAEVNGAK